MHLPLHKFMKASSEQKHVRFEIIATRAERALPVI